MTEMCATWKSDWETFGDPDFPGPGEKDVLGLGCFGTYNKIWDLHENEN